MRRFSVLLGVAVIVVVLPAAGAVVPVPKEKESPARQLQAKLDRPVSVPGFEPNTPLKEALGYLSERFGVPILIDKPSFNDLQVPEPEAQPVKLPALKEVALRVVLELTVAQCMSEIVQRGNVLWVVTKARAHRFGLEQPVDFACEDRSLGKVLKELSGRTGYNIVLDRRRVGKAAEQGITLEVAGESLEAVVKLAADLAGLDVVEMGKSLYVTTSANAVVMKKKAPRKSMPPALDLGL